jgi:hypothetical protein
MYYDERIHEHQVHFLRILMYQTSIMITLVTKVERRPNVTGESPIFKYDKTKAHVNHKLLNLKALVKPRRIHKRSAYQISAFLLSNL